MFEKEKGKNMADPARAAKMADRIKVIIAKTLERGLKDPRLGFVTITDVKVTGLSLPNMCKPYVHAGVIESVVLWKTKDLGYLVVQAAKAIQDGTLHQGVASITAGRLGGIEVRGGNIMLGAPFIFTKQNIDQFNF